MPFGADDKRRRVIIGVIMGVVVLSIAAYFYFTQIRPAIAPASNVSNTAASAPASAPAPPPAPVSNTTNSSSSAHSAGNSAHAASTPHHR